MLCRSKSSVFAMLLLIISFYSCRTTDSKNNAVGDKDGWILGFSKFIRPELGQFKGYGLVLCNANKSPNLANGKFDDEEFNQSCSFVFTQNDAFGVPMIARFAEIPKNTIQVRAEQTFDSESKRIQNETKNQNANLTRNMKIIEVISGDKGTIVVLQSELDSLEQKKKIAIENKRVADEKKKNMPMPVPVPMPVKKKLVEKKDANGNVIRDGNGNPLYVEVDDVPPPAAVPPPPPDYDKELKDIEAMIVKKVELQKKADQDLAAARKGVTDSDAKIKELAQEKSVLSVESVLLSFGEKQKELADHFGEVFKGDFEKPSIVIQSIPSLLTVLAREFNLQFSCQVAVAFPDLGRDLEIQPCAKPLKQKAFDWADVRGESAVLTNGTYDGGAFGRILVEVENQIVGGATFTNSIGLKFIDTSTLSSATHNIGTTYVCDRVRFVCLPKTPNGVILKMDRLNAFSIVNLDGDAFTYNRQIELNVGIYREDIKGTDGILKSIFWAISEEVGDTYKIDAMSPGGVDYVATGFRFISPLRLEAERRIQGANNVITIDKMYIDLVDDTHLRLKLNSTQNESRSVQFHHSLVPALKAGMYGPTNGNVFQYRVKTIQTYPYIFEVQPPTGQGNAIRFECPAGNPGDAMHMCRSNQPNVMAIFNAKTRLMESFKLKRGEPEVFLKRGGDLQ